MRYPVTLFIMVLISGAIFAQRNTTIPNNDFESWINYGDYTNPEFWDTPNEELESIPFFGTSVVTKSNDHQSGAFSVKLESKEITLVGVIPGFITLGNITVDITAGTYVITGGVPVTDSPTHLKGYYKYSPKGGDSCVIGIGLFRWNNGVRDTVGVGYFSSLDTVTEWTYFSVWINYISSEPPDSMNIIAVSSAQLESNAGTVLLLDNLYLDYTVGVDNPFISQDIDIYQERGSRSIHLFYDFDHPESAQVSLYNMLGQRVAGLRPETVRNESRVLEYGTLPGGIYVLEVIHNNQRFSRKLYL